jgi:hypothetical protein
MIRVASATDPNSIGPDTEFVRTHGTRDDALFTTSVQQKCEAASCLAVDYARKQGAIASRHRCLTVGVPSFEHADGCYANTGTVHKGKPQYRPRQTQALQVLQSRFCSS